MAGRGLRGLLLLAVWGTLAVPAAADCPPKGMSVGELTNPFLGPRYAQWLVGPVSCLATEEEITGFLLLKDDDEAERFVAAFWDERQRIRPGFEERVEIADKRFREGTIAGSRTDRGTIFVVYGEPEEISYEEYRDVSEPDVEQWKYGKKSPPGLDGNKPKPQYRFARQGDLTTFYHKRPSADPRQRTRVAPPNSTIPPPLN